MKTRILSLVATAALALGGCDGSKGEKGPAGPAGPDGPAGPSGVTPPVDVGQGIVFDIQSATVAEGAAPTVTFRVRDAQGAPVDLKAEAVANTFRPSFVLARLGADGKWTSYLTRTATGRSYTEAGVSKTAALPTAVQAAAQGICPGTATGSTVCPQADQDRLVASADGVYTYTFLAPVTGVDAAATHRVGIYGRRTFEGVGQPGSNTFDFVPAGGTPQQRDVITDEACNRCHTVVNAHGGSRRGVKLCLTCHSPQTIDPETAENVDMARMIHKIHKGKLLANGYTIIGNSQSVHDFSHVAMGPSHNTYFELTQPAAPAPATPAIADRGIIRECALCHQGAQADLHKTSLSATNCNTCHDDVNPSDQPLTTRPGLVLAPGTGHLVGGGPLPAANTACVNCHGGATPVIGVERAHSVNYEPTRNMEFTGTHKFALKIDKVNNAISGGPTAPNIEFTVTLDGAPYDLFTQTAATATVTGRSLGALGFQFAGPIEDYKETAPTAFGAVSGATGGVANPARITVIDAATGKYRFTFAAPLAAGKTGTYVASFEAYFKESKLGPSGETISKPYAADPVFRGTAKNVAYVNIATGAASTAERRLITANAKCNNCHEDIGFHGNRSRQGVDYCATCHDPNLSNAGRSRFQLADVKVQTGMIGAALAGTPAAGQPVFVAESVSTEVFIHKIHMGAELSAPYKLGTNRTATDPTPGAEGLADFSQFEAPSPMGNCQTCHEGETYAPPELPQSPVLQAVMSCPQQDAAGWCFDTNATTGAVIRPPTIATLVTPGHKAVCSSCHDTDAERAHMDLNTIAPNTLNAIETCTACHGKGKDFDAIKMHPPVLAPTVDLPDDAP